MTRKEEIKKRLEKIQGLRFWIAMKDNWSREDFNRDLELSTEQLKLEKELKELA